MSETSRLSKNLIVVAKIVKAIDSALADDGNINAKEGINIAFKAVELIGVVKNLKEAKAEILELDNVGIEKLVEEFKVEFDITNDVAEAVVEQILTLAISLLVSLEIIGK